MRGLHHHNSHGGRDSGTIMSSLLPGRLCLSFYKAAMYQWKCSSTRCSGICHRSCPRIAVLPNSDECIDSVHCIMDSEHTCLFLRRMRT